MPQPLDRLREGQSSPARIAVAELAQVRAVLFDMGDVLFDATIWRRWLWRLLKQVGVRATYAELFARWDHPFLDSVHRGERNYADAFREFLASEGLSQSQTDEVHAASLAKSRELAATTRAFPRSCQTVARLRRAGIGAGVLSDSERTAVELAARLKRMGFESHFDLVLSSIDLGCTKPDPRTYRAAVDRWRLEPGQIAFVGHDRVELEGAAAAGMPTIGFNCDRDARPQCAIESFDQLLDLLGIRSAARLAC